MNQSVLTSNEGYHNEHLEKLIAKCQLNSEVILEKHGLTDRDMPIVIKEAIIQRQCAELWLKYNSITSHGALILADALRHNATLYEIYLYGNNICDTGTRFLAQALSDEHSTLKRLSLGSNEITDQGAYCLANMLKTNRTLRHLLLSANQIGDRGCLSLTNALIYHNSTLERIDLDSNRAITDVSAKSFVATMKINDNLIGLNVSDCKLTAASKEQLQRVATAKEYFQLWV